MSRTRNSLISPRKTAPKKYFLNPLDNFGRSSILTPDDNDTTKERTMNVIINFDTIIHAETGTVIQECGSQEQATLIAADCGFNVIGWIY